ncbi:MAG: DUF4832 domain-containing protein [Fibrobacter sp.]|nr:DUF4832 domain-containing protein [Fibrobacter sp.]
MKKSFALFVLMLVCAFGAAGAASMVKQDLDYSDHLVDIAKNPGRGVTSHRGIYLAPGKKLELTGNLIYADFMRFLVDLGGFSSNAWSKIDSTVTPRDTTFRGTSQELDEVSLNNIRAVLDSVRRRGGTCTIRASYDVDCRGHQDPDINTILRHTEQLAKVYGEYEDVIHYVELGMYGTCGEQNNANVSFDDVVRILQTFLENSTSGIKVGMRSPQTVGAWLGLRDYYQHGTDSWYIYPDWRIDSERFQDSAKARGEYMHRVGLYNDGYLGSDDDLGTFVETGGAQGPITREHIIEWMEEYGKDVPYGGDFVCNYNGKNRPPLNTAEYMAYEGFRTHTSYLSGFGSGACYNHMDSTLFMGPDPEFHQKVTGKDYIRMHVGYRFVVRNSRMMDSVAVGGTLKMKVKIQNVGFANSYMAKVPTLILKQENETDTAILELPLDIDPTKIYSKKLKMKTGIDDNPTKMWTGLNYWDIMDSIPEFDGVNELAPEIQLPEDMPLGEWKVYMRISQYGNYKTDNNYHVVQFANDTNYFDKNTGSNYIGKFILAEAVDVEDTLSRIVDPNDALASSLNNFQMRVENRCIFLSRLSKNERITLFDMQGRILYQKNATASSIEVATPSSGSYLLRVGCTYKKVYVK